MRDMKGKFFRFLPPTYYPPINQAGGQKGFAFLTTCFLIIQPVLLAVLARNIRRRWLFAPICI